MALAVLVARWGYTLVQTPGNLDDCLSATEITGKLLYAIANLTLYSMQTTCLAEN